MISVICQHQKCLKTTLLKSINLKKNVYFNKYVSCDAYPCNDKYKTKYKQKTTSCDINQKKYFNNRTFKTKWQHDSFHLNYFIRYTNRYSKFTRTLIKIKNAIKVSRFLGFPVEIKRKRSNVVHTTVRSVLTKTIDISDYIYVLSYYTYTQLTVDLRVSFHDFFEITVSETACCRRRGSRTDKPTVQLTFFQAQWTTNSNWFSIGVVK